MYRIIPLIDQRAAELASRLVSGHNERSGTVKDIYARPLRDLRISVIDRCNFRCVYCMPKEIFNKDYRFLPRPELLSFEEIHRLAAIFSGLGVEKLRVTGGEPLLRKNIELLIAALASLRTASGNRLDLAMTTNGSLLERLAMPLKEAGLRRITVSLDGLENRVFRQMSDAQVDVSSVLKGIDAAQSCNFESIKVNMVVKKGLNDDQILPMARYFRGRGATLRFIEYMDVGSSNGWRMDEVMPGSDILARLRSEFDMERVAPNYPAETAQRWRYADGAGEIGLVASVTHAFCGDCTRARLSPEGKIYTCLFASSGIDLRSLLRSGKDDDEIAGFVARAWQIRTDRYSEQRAHGDEKSSPAAGNEKIEMSYIGG